MATLRIGLIPQGGAVWIAGVVYLQNLIRAARRLPPAEQPDFHLLCSVGMRDYTLMDAGEPQVPISFYSYRHGIPTRTRLRAIARSLSRGIWPRSFENLVARRRLDAVFPVMYPNGEHSPAPTIGWIPDFQHRRLPQFFSPGELRDRDSAFRRLIDETSHVVVSSQDAYDDLMRWFPTDESKVSVLRFRTMPGPEWFAGQPMDVVHALGLPERFLMFPSQLWQHKNHLNLLRAISLLQDSGLGDVVLVLTGVSADYRRPDFPQQVADQIREMGLGGRVRLLGLLPRCTQIQLMRQAVAIVQPSYFEGWSALVEDCRSLGKRIYLSDIPIHREQEPPNAVFFNPDRPEELAEKLVRDWPRLAPSWNSEAERLAVSRIDGNAVQYAREFVEIVRKAAMGS